MKISNLPVRRDAYLTPAPSGIVESLLDPRTRESTVLRWILSDTAFISVITSFLVTAVWFMLHLPLHESDLGFGHFTDAGLVMVEAFVPLFVFVFLTITPKINARHDAAMIQSARSRVLELINGSGDDETAHGHFARSVLCSPDEWTGGRDLLMRLDAITVQHAKTQRRIEHDAAKCSVARAIARKACYDMITSFKEDAGDRGVDGELEDLSRACHAIASGRPLDARTSSYAPTARIGRIISTAERMLSDHPDLVDAHGARVDDLIRIHVPRLLERHRVAAETASAKDLEAVDAQLDAAVEEVRESVQEAADAIHDEAMQALSTELRFLSLRRGSTPLLTAVS